MIWAHEVAATSVSKENIVNPDFIALKFKEKLELYLDNHYQKKNPIAGHTIIKV